MGDRRCGRLTIHGRAFCRPVDVVEAVTEIITRLPGRWPGHRSVFGCSAILVVLVGAWITGDWITVDGDIRRWHPGCFLPTAAGGLLAGGASAALGFTTLSHVLFGLGITSFVVLASIISQRLYVVPSLPPPLLPTIAIEVAPPVVAGNSWFAINGGKVDTPAAILAGLSLLMLLVQLRLIPLYRRASFGPGFWAFSSPFAAAVTYGVHWLAAEHVRSGTALGYALVGVLTAGFALLAARTVTGLIHGTFLPRVPTADQAPVNRLYGAFAPRAPRSPVHRGSRPPGRGHRRRWRPGVTAPNRRAGGRPGCCKPRQ